jgi:DNA-binding response OmpR family regulator
MRQAMVVPLRRARPTRNETSPRFLRNIANKSREGASVGSAVGAVAEGCMDVQGRKLAINGVIADFGSETLLTASGHSVALRPQAFAVLRYLAERAGQLATKTSLFVRCGLDSP